MALEEIRVGTQGAWDRFYSWRRLGVHVVPAHRYRLTAVYENRTGRSIRDGGMGAVTSALLCFLKTGDHIHLDASGGRVHRL